MSFSSVSMSNLLIKGVGDIEGFCLSVCVGVKGGSVEQVSCRGLVGGKGLLWYEYSSVPSNVSIVDVSRGKGKGGKKKSEGG